MSQNPTQTDSKMTDDVFEVDRLKAEANKIASKLVGHMRTLGGRLTGAIFACTPLVPASA